MKRHKIHTTILWGVLILNGSFYNPEAMQCKYYEHEEKRHEFCYNKAGTLFTNRVLTDDVSVALILPEGENTQ